MVLQKLIEVFRQKCLWTLTPDHAPLSIFKLKKSFLLRRESGQALGMVSRANGGGLGREQGEEHGGQKGQYGKGSEVGLHRCGLGWSPECGQRVV